MQKAPVASLEDDEALLALMLGDASRQNELYRPGAYWSRKTRNTTDQIRRLGIGDFRGASSSIGLSFTDSVHVDVRYDLCGGLRGALRVLLTSMFPFNMIFGAQVSLTRSHEAEARRLRSLVLGSDPRVVELVERYSIPPSLLGGCLDSVVIGERRVATYYLNLLHQHDRVAGSCPFTGISSMLEIGGGFGAHVHCLVENYPRLRKIVYLDIPPNLYIGTQYLRAIYGTSVRDYRQTRELADIEFSSNDALEILAIAPWQIERLRVGVDLLYNAHSFVEMPEHAIANYAQRVAALPGFDRMRVVMLTYGNFDPRTTLPPDRLPGFFPAKTFSRTEFPMLDRSFAVISFVSQRGQGVQSRGGEGLLVF
jgi:putative sugar O-methyltransferase